MSYERSSQVIKGHSEVKAKGIEDWISFKMRCKPKRAGGLARMNASGNTPQPQERISSTPNEPEDALLQGVVMGIVLLDSDWFT
jgi:hypothetical protein